MIITVHSTLEHAVLDLGNTQHFSSRISPLQMCQASPAYTHTLDALQHNCKNNIITMQEDTS
jgi:hypothetical protein